MNNVLFPNGYKCLICGTEIVPGHFDICDACYLKLPFISGKVCLGCGESIFSSANYCLNCKNTKRYFEQCFSLFNFDGEIKKLIHELKYDGKKYVAKTLSNFLLKQFAVKNLNVDVIIPIPLHESKFKIRGFNQSELLCSGFIKFGFNVDTTSLIRIKDTTTQTNLTKQERLKNMENAFKCVNKKLVKGKTVLLIDDVYTTGATFNEASKVLINAGASKVYGLTVAHTVLNKS